MDSAELFTLLQRHVTRLENTVRWTWRDGDIAIRDNRATINGDTAVVRKGDASHYSDPHHVTAHRSGQYQCLAVM